MAIVKKQFSTFSVSYVDTEINSDDFWQYGVDVENDNTSVHLRGGNSAMLPLFKFVLMMNNKFEKHR